ncbi:MAG: hypothetical protein ACM3PB_00770, partial [Betaproteobacteria bacterium]
AIVPMATRDSKSIVSSIAFHRRRLPGAKGLSLGLMRLINKETAGLCLDSLCHMPFANIYHAGFIYMAYLLYSPC